MTKTYRVTGSTRLVNRVMGAFIRLGIMPARMRLLTVRGRSTGKLHSNPVSLVISGDRRYLVSPYGIVNWVKNARASGEVKITRGRNYEMLKVRELPPDEAAPILRTYFTGEPITREYFSVTLESPLEAFAGEAAAHPVFELVK